MTNPVISFRDTSSIHPISLPLVASLFTPLPSTVPTPAMKLDENLFRPSTPQIPRGHIDTQSLSYCPATCGRKPVRSLGWTIFQRGRMYCGLRSCWGTCQRFTARTCPLVVYASKRCSSGSDHRLCLFVRKRPCLVVLEHPSSSLLRSVSISLKILALSLLNDLFHLRCQSLGIHGSAGSGSDTRRIFVDRVLPSQQLRL